MELKRSYWSAAFLLSLALVVGCGGSPSTVSPPPPPYAASIKVVSGNNQTATVGTSVSQRPTVRVSDQKGSPMAGVTVTWTVMSGGGIVDATSNLTGSDGTASTRWTLGSLSGSNSLAAGSGSLSPVTFVATGTAGAAAAIQVVNGDNQTATVGTAVSQPPTVFVSDQNGNALAGVAVTWTVISGGGLIDVASNMTGSGGTAGVGWTLGTQAGANAIIAASGSLVPVVFNATGTPGPAANITITPPNSPMQTGDMLQLSATAADAYGNALPDPLPNVVWTSSDRTIAEVTADAFLVGVAPGTASIFAKSGAVTGSLRFNIDAGITFTFGAEETVFDYTVDRCEALDLPDVRAHVVRTADGSLVLMAADGPRNYVMVGRDFSSLHRICSHPALISGDSYYPETYENWEWIHSLYLQGGIIHALITNEYHDPFSPYCTQGYTGPGNPCWYNSITYAFSSDEGHTFTHAVPPGHVVAPPWEKWDASTGTPTPYGYFFPSNIVLGSDNAYYSLIFSWARAGDTSMCLMRTLTLEDPASWRAWDGTGFNLEMTSPYTGEAPPRCTAVISPPQVLVGSLTYNMYLAKYMLVGEGTVGGPAQPICGVFYELSSDLINWSPMRLLRFAPIPWSGDCYPQGGYIFNAYSSIIDHDDATINFEKPGRSPYVYYTRFNDTAYDRDLVRIRVTITAH